MMTDEEDDDESDWSDDAEDALDKSYDASNVQVIIEIIFLNDTR